MVRSNDEIYALMETILKKVNKNNELLHEIQRRLDLTENVPLIQMPFITSEAEFEELNDNIVKDSQYANDLKTRLVKDTEGSAKLILNALIDETFLKNHMNMNGRDGRINFYESPFYNEIYLKMKQAAGVNSKQAREEMIFAFRRVKNRGYNRAYRHREAGHVSIDIPETKVLKTENQDHQFSYKEVSVEKVLSGNKISTNQGVTSKLRSSKSSTSKRMREESSESEESNDESEQEESYYLNEETIVEEEEELNPLALTDKYSPKKPINPPVQKQIQSPAKVLVSRTNLDGSKSQYTITNPSNESSSKPRGKVQVVKKQNPKQKVLYRCHICSKLLPGREIWILHQETHMTDFKIKDECETSSVESGD